MARYNAQNETRTQPILWLRNDELTHFHTNNTFGTFPYIGKTAKEAECERAQCDRQNSLKRTNNTNAFMRAKTHSKITLTTMGKIHQRACGAVHKERCIANKNKEILYLNSEKRR